MTRRAPAREYRIAIPSYKRAELLERCTLSLVLASGVAAERVTVFLDDNDPQLSAYRDLADRTGIAVHVSAARGIQGQRREVHRHYAPGTPVVQLDDDVTALKAVVGGKLTALADLDEFFRGMFTETAGRDLFVWGVGPVPNAFYMREGRISDGLKFVIYTAVGYFNRPNHPVQEMTVPVKEDYELSLRAWWYDGGVVRNDGVAVVADHYTAPGGCQEYRDGTQNAEAGRALAAAWPGLVRPNPRRGSGYEEILLTPKKRAVGHRPEVPPPGETMA